MRIFHVLAIGMGLLFFHSIGFAKSGGHFEFSGFNEVSRLVDEKIEQFGPGQVLLVLDIDNTTLVTETDLGSEHWFLWQAQLIGDGRQNEAIAETIPELLALQSNILSLSKMRPVEEQIPRELSRWGGRGVRMLALTSRGLANHDSTVREFKRNGFPYETFSPSGPRKISEEFFPYELAHPEKSGLTNEEVEAFNLGKPTEVFWGKGLYLTEMQHKGIMLRVLLHKLRQRYQSIIFIDDRLKHSVGMQEAFSGLGTEITTVQYTHEAEKIRRFNENDKSEVKRSWCEFSKALTVLDPKRFHFRAACN